VETKTVLNLSFDQCQIEKDLKREEKKCHCLCDEKCDYWYKL